MIMSYLSMFRVNDKDSRGLEVPLKALWRKATGGGGRLRQATAREEKRKKNRRSKRRNKKRRKRRRKRRSKRRGKRRGKRRRSKKRRYKRIIYSLEYNPILEDFETQGLWGVRIV